MKRKMRLGLPGLGVAVLIAAAVLLTIRPWSDGPPAKEAAAHPSDYGICNVSVRNLPEGVRAEVWPFKEMGEISEGIYLMVSIPEVDDPGVSLNDRSRVVWDAVSGDLEFEYYRTPAEEAKLKGVVRRVGRWEPVGPAWPRTDTPPQGDMAEVRKPADVTTPQGKVVLRYRQAEYGSGLLGILTRGDSFAELRVFTCESEMVIDGWTGSVTRRQVVPEEEAMFQRFLEGVETP